MWEMALKTKEDMLLAHVKPNIVTWSSLIGACANSDLVDQAIQLFEEMLSSGCEPNTQCCNILLHACVKGCQYDRAFRFFNSWKVNGFKVHVNELEGHTKIVPFKPSTATFNILMKACGTDYHHVKDLMNEMKEMGLSPNRISWSVLIDICGSSCNMGGALQVTAIERKALFISDLCALIVF